MKLIAHIQYKNCIFTSNLEFGNGESTIKALGLTAAQSFIAQNASARGLLRHRNSAFACTHGSFYLPVEVSRDSKFADSTFLDPDNSIKTYFHDGEDVYIKLLTKIDINSKGLPYVKSKFEHLSKYNNEMKEEYEPWEEEKCAEKEEENEAGSGQPFNQDTDYHEQMNDWFVLAFRKNHLSNDQLEKIRNRNRLEEIAAIKKLEAFEHKEKEAELAKQTERIRSMFDTQIYTEVRQNHLMDSAWIQLTQFGRLDKIVQDPVEQDLIKKLFFENYILIWELFRNFASIIQDSSTELIKLDIWEFKHFITKLKLLNSEDRDSNPAKFDSLINNIFSECLPDEVVEIQKRKRELYSAEFFLSLIHIAHIMYIDTTIQKHMPHLSYTQSNKKRSFLLSYTARGNELTLKGDATESYNTAMKNTETAPHKALRRLIKEYILPYGNYHLQTFVAKQALSQNSVLVHYAEANEYLIAAYKKYSYLGPGISLMQNFMWYKQIMDMGIECKLVDANFDLRKWSEWPFYLREIRLVLGTVLAEGNEQSDTEEKMCYPEFLEGIARLSIEKYKEDQRLSVREKIYHGIQSIVQQMKHEKKKGRKQAAIGRV